MSFPSSSTPVWRIRMADAAGRAYLHRPCKTRDCAIASVSPFEGDTVLAIECSDGTVEPVAPQSGLAFRLAHLDAVERAHAPRVADAA